MVTLDNRRSWALWRAVFAVALAAALTPFAAPAQNSNPFGSSKLYVDPNSKARQTAEQLRRTRPADAAALERIAAQPTVKWMGDWSPNIRRDVQAAVQSISRTGALPVFVAYNIPNRDCGSYSAGGQSSAAGYKRWIREFAEGLSGRKAVVILEPDALAGADCLKPAQRAERYALMRDAVQVLKAKNAVVYLDAGHAKWQRPEVIASRLAEAAIDQADGFSLNISNYIPNPTNISYGEQVSRRVGGKHFIIDTSRNGIGTPNGEWCNAQGQALGRAPTTQTGHQLVDAFLWVKLPGESDGECGRGNPRAGQWWTEYAIGLAKRG
jgi:endoglucanase